MHSARRHSSFLSLVMAQGAVFALSFLFLNTGCKRADADTQAVSASEMENRLFPPVDCLARLENLSASDAERDWAQVSLDRAVNLCKGAISTAPVDCALNANRALEASLDAAKSNPALSALEGVTKPLELAVRLCVGSDVESGEGKPAACFVERVMAGSDLSTAGRICVAASHSTGNHISNTATSEAGKRPAVVEACFQAARKIAVSSLAKKPGAMLSDALAARLCAPRI